MLTINVDLGGLVPVTLWETPLHAILTVPPYPEVLFRRSMFRSLRMQRLTKVAKRMVYLWVSDYLVEVGPSEITLEYFRAFYCLVYDESQVIRMYLPCIDVGTRREEPIKQDLI